MQNEKDKLIKTVRRFKDKLCNMNDVEAAVDAYSAALIAAKPFVSLSLPPSESSDEILCSHCGVRDAIQTGKYCMCCGAELPQFGGNAS